MEKIKHPRSVRWWVVAAGVLVAVAAAAWFGRGYLVSSAGAASQLPPPPLSPSRYLNTGADAQYVGSAGCVECHRSNHASYLQTPHSQALAALKKAVEIRPYRHDIHGDLAHAYRVAGDEAKARDHLARARWLLENRQE